MNPRSPASIQASRNLYVFAEINRQLVIYRRAEVANFGPLLPPGTQEPFYGFDDFEAEQIATAYNNQGWNAKVVRADDQVAHNKGLLRCVITVEEK